MKRNVILALVLVLALSIFLVSCSADDRKESSEPAKETEEKSAKEEPKEEVAEEDHVIKLGEPIVMGDYEITVQAFDIIDDFEGNPLFRITYDWKNNSDKEKMSIGVFNFSGYQDGVETEIPLAVSDDLDLQPSTMNVEPGYAQEGVHAALSIDPSRPMQVKLSEITTFSDKIWTYEFTAE